MPITAWFAGKRIGLEPPPQRDVLYERFRKVILSAGYKNPQPTLDNYFEEYMKDVPAFIKMLEDYEKNDGDPE